MTTREVLIEARKLIEKPEDWCHGVASGKCCALVALKTVVGPHVIGSPAYRALRDEVGSIAHFNDTHSHGEILDLFDRAIEAA